MHALLYWNGVRLIALSDSRGGDTSAAAADVRLSSAADSRLIVADSYRSRNGSVIAHGAHQERFRRSVEAQFWLPEPGPNALFSPRQWQAYFAACSDKLPVDSDAFPRHELWLLPRPQLRFRMRPTPTLSAHRCEEGAAETPEQAHSAGSTVSLRSVFLSAENDPRPFPWHKGPSIGTVRDRGAGFGHAAALWRSATGDPIETDTAALMCWFDGELFVAPATLPRVQSVTERVLLRLAADAGVRCVHSWQGLPRLRLDSGQQAEPLPEQLSGQLSGPLPAPHMLASVPDLCAAEVWAVNALHGIRLVSSVDGRRCAAPDLGRLQRYREALVAGAESAVTPQPTECAAVTASANPQQHPASE